MRLNIAPSEFWKMRPRHFWYMFETLEPPRRKKNELTRSDVRRLNRLIARSDAKLKGKADGS